MSVPPPVPPPPSMHGSRRTRGSRSARPDRHGEHLTQGSADDSQNNAESARSHRRSDSSPSHRRSLSSQPVPPTHSTHASYPSYAGPYATSSSNTTASHPTAPRLPVTAHITPPPITSIPHPVDQNRQPLYPGEYPHGVSLSPVQEQSDRGSLGSIATQVLTMNTGSATVDAPMTSPRPLGQTPIFTNFTTPPDVRMSRIPPIQPQLSAPWYMARAGATQQAHQGQTRPSIPAHATHAVFTVPTAGPEPDGGGNRSSSPWLPRWLSHRVEHGSTLSPPLLGRWSVGHGRQAPTQYLQEMQAMHGMQQPVPRRAFRSRRNASSNSSSTSSNGHSQSQGRPPSQFPSPNGPEHTYRPAPAPPMHPPISPNVNASLPGPPTPHPHSALRQSRRSASLPPLPPTPSTAPPVYRQAPADELPPLIVSYRTALAKAKVGSTSLLSVMIWGPHDDAARRVIAGVVKSVAPELDYDAHVVAALHSNEYLQAAIFAIESILYQHAVGLAQVPREATLKPRTKARMVLLGCCLTVPEEPEARDRPMSQHSERRSPNGSHQPGSRPPTVAHN